MVRLRCATIPTQSRSSLILLHRTSGTLIAPYMPGQSCVTNWGTSLIDKEQDDEAHEKEIEVFERHAEDTQFPANDPGVQWTRESEHGRQCSSYARFS
jgi:hypothetical protein